jgi:hypothetical protein
VYRYAKLENIGLDREGVAIAPRGDHAAFDELVKSFEADVMRLALSVSDDLRSAVACYSGNDFGFVTTTESKLAISARAAAISPAMSPDGKDRADIKKHVQSLGCSSGFLEADFGQLSSAPPEI